MKLSLLMSFYQIENRVDDRKEKLYLCVKEIVENESGNIIILLISVLRKKTNVKNASLR